MTVCKYIATLKPLQGTSLAVFCTLYMSTYFILMMILTLILQGRKQRCRDTEWLTRASWVVSTEPAFWCRAPGMEVLAPNPGTHPGGSLGGASASISALTLAICPVWISLSYGICVLPPWNGSCCTASQGSWEGCKGGGMHMHHTAPACMRGCTETMGRWSPEKQGNNKNHSLKDTKLTWNYSWYEIIQIS